MKWNCEACGCILGVLDRNAETLRMKVRDVYIFITGGEITITCRKCGKINQLQQQKPKLTTVDELISGGSDGL